MITCHFYKAQGFRDIHVESKTIVFAEELPEAESAKEHAGMCQLQAEAICSVLLNTLAQGVTDRILAILLAKKASMLVFPQEGFGE